MLCKRHFIAKAIPSCAANRSGPDGRSTDRRQPRRGATQPEMEGRPRPDPRGVRAGAVQDVTGLLCHLSFSHHRRCPYRITRGAAADAKTLTCEKQAGDDSGLAGSDTGRGSSRGRPLETHKGNTAKLRKVLILGQLRPGQRRPFR